MAFTTYVDLKQAVSHWVGGSDDATASTLGITSTLDDLITLGEERIFREGTNPFAISEPKGFSTGIFSRG